VTVAATGGAGEDGGGFSLSDSGRSGFGQAFIGRKSENIPLRFSTGNGQKGRFFETYPFGRLSALFFSCKKIAPRACKYKKLHLSLSLEIKKTIMTALAIFRSFHETVRALPFTQRPLPFTRGALPFTRRPLLLTGGALPFTRFLLPFTHGALPLTENALLPTRRPLLLTGSALPFTRRMYRLFIYL
jgi:hypothetical protein